MISEEIGLGIGSGTSGLRVVDQILTPNEDKAINISRPKTNPFWLFMVVPLELTTADFSSSHLKQNFALSGFS
jgi:hypothetical protein